MRLYNTLSKKYDKLQIDHDTVKIYLCGVTVYDESHIGHARTIIIFDVLHRFFLSKGYKVIFIQNFTDIDDKIIKKAKLLNKNPKEIAEKYIEQYFKDAYSLNVSEEIHYPKATEHIKEIIENIGGNIKLNKSSISGAYFILSFKK